MLTKHLKLSLECIVPVTNIEKGKEGVVLYKGVMIKIYSFRMCVIKCDRDSHCSFFQV